MAIFRSQTANRTLYGFLGLVGLIVVVLYVVTPFMFLWFPGITRTFIFEPKEEIPENVDYQHPEKAGFIGGRNFYLPTQDGVQIGVWHTLPFNLEEEAANLSLKNMDSLSASEIYKDWMSDATVFLYVHGSAGTRTSPHRLKVYRLLNKLNYHVITFDYRGYGDSTGVPLNETDVVEDTKTVYSWIRDKVSSGNIFLWGHSLGTGVGSHLADLVVNRRGPLSGIVLEAPFNNMADAVRASSLAKLVSFIPWFEHCFIRPLKDNDMEFQSDRHLSNIPTPVLVLHAKDDPIIPYHLAVNLYEAVATSRKDPTSVRLISYDANLGYGHYNIPLDPNLNTTVRDFVTKSLH